MSRLVSTQSYLTLLVLCFSISAAATPSSKHALSPLSSPLSFQTTELDDGSGVSRTALVLPRQNEASDIRIDGRVTEDVWHSLPTHTEFYVTDPDTLKPAPLKTTWRMFYNNEGLYVSAVCAQKPEVLVERLSARDQGFLNRDYVSFVLDTSGESRYGFWFQLNLGGSRSDGTVLPERQFSDTWDGAWRGDTARFEEGWSAEFFVPWSIVSMPRMDGERHMGIVLQRKVAYTDERYGYPPLPFTQPRFMSGLQKIVLQDVEPNQQLSFFPQVSTTHDSMAGETSSHVGADVFWRPSTNFQVTATVDPDFGTVEADSVIINLSAVETFFPEKRLFFLEGQDVFVPSDRAGRWSSNTPVMLLHTRRIGQRPIVPDLPVDAEFEWADFSQPSDLIGAAKATGQAGPFRYGVLTAFEDDTTFWGIRDDEAISVTAEGREFAVARALLEKSNGNYRGIGLLSTFTQHPTVDAATHGLDAHYFSSGGKLKIDSQILVSDIAGIEDGFGGFVELNYAPIQGITHELVAESFDDRINLNYLGYLPRNDIETLRYRFRYRKFLNDWFKETYTRFSLRHSRNGDDQVVSSEIDVSQQFTFHNQTQFRVSAEYEAEAYDDLNSFGAGSFLLDSTADIDLQYQSDSAKRLFYQVSASYETESILGDRVSGGTFLVWRPSDRLSMNAMLRYSNRDSWLLYQGNQQFTAFASESWSPTFGLDFFLSAQQHFRFDLEWRAIKARESTFHELPLDSVRLLEIDDPDVATRDDFAISRLNLQLRYRWELAPMSDLYVVYSKRASLPDALAYDFNQQFGETLDHPVSEGLVVKLRHHLGT